MVATINKIKGSLMLHHLINVIKNAKKKNLNPIKDIYLQGE